MFLWYNIDIIAFKVVRSLEHNSHRFLNVISQYNFQKIDSSIGTIGEKALHAIIKSYYDDDKDNHEVDVCGFVADIKCGDKIIEIQTSSFDRLNKKLEKYLNDYDVTVVYPIALNKNIIWIDPQTGDVVAKNKSNKRGRATEFLFEASKIRGYINNDNLHFEILLIDMDEYKLLDGYGPDRKRRCTKLYKMPSELRECVVINGADDVRKILPPEITDGRFTFAEFEKYIKMKDRRARYSLNTLIEYGIVREVDKSGRAKIYETVK